MGRRFILLLFQICLFSPLFSQLLSHNQLPYAGPGAYSKQQATIFGFTVNPAALTQQQQKAIGVYTTRPYLLQALSTHQLAAVLPFSNGNFGLQLQYGGFKNYNETNIGLAYGRNIGKTLSLGIQFTYNRQAIPGQYKGGGVGATAGLIYHLTEKLNGGLYFTKTGVLSTGKSLSQQSNDCYGIGLGYDVSKQFFIGVNIEKETSSPAGIAVAMQYNFMEQLYGQFCLLTTTHTPFVAVGTAWKKLQVAISGSYHPHLGISPGLQLIFSHKQAVNNNL